MSEPTTRPLETHEQLDAKVVETMEKLKTNPELLIGQFRRNRGGFLLLTFIHHARIMGIDLPFDKLIALASLHIALPAEVGAVLGLGAFKTFEAYVVENSEAVSNELSTFFGVASMTHFYNEFTKSIIAPVEEPSEQSQENNNASSNPDTTTK